MVPSRTYSYFDMEEAMRKQVMTAVLTVVLAGGWYAAQAGARGMGMGRGGDNGPQAEAGAVGCRQQQTNCRQDGDPRRQVERMTEELGLSDSQRQQVEAIVTAQEEQDAPLREKIAAGKRQLWEAARGGAMDEAAVADLAAEQAKLMSEMMVSRLRVKTQIFAILTPEQQAQAERLDDLRGPGCGGPGCGRGPGRGPVDAE